MDFFIKNMTPSQQQTTENGKDKSSILETIPQDQRDAFVQYQKEALKNLSSIKGNTSPIQQSIEQCADVQEMKEMAAYMGHISHYPFVDDRLGHTMHFLSSPVEQRKRFVQYYQNNEVFTKADAMIADATKVLGKTPSRLSYEVIKEDVKQWFSQRLLDATPTIYTKAETESNIARLQKAKMGMHPKEGLLVLSLSLEKRIEQKEKERHKERGTYVTEKLGKLSTHLVTKETIEKAKDMVMDPKKCSYEMLKKWDTKEFSVWVQGLEKRRKNLEKSYTARIDKVSKHLGAQETERSKKWATDKKTPIADLRKWNTVNFDTHVEDIKRKDDAFEEHIIQNKSLTSEEKEDLIQTYYSVDHHKRDKIRGQAEKQTITADKQTKSLIQIMRINTPLLSPSEIADLSETSMTGDSEEKSKKIEEITTLSMGREKEKKDISSACREIESYITKDKTMLGRNLTGKTLEKLTPFTQKGIPAFKKLRQELQNGVLHFGLSESLSSQVEKMPVITTSSSDVLTLEKEIKKDTEGISTFINLHLLTLVDDEVKKAGAEENDSKKALEKQLQKKQEEQDAFSDLPQQHSVEQISIGTETSAKRSLSENADLIHTAQKKETVVQLTGDGEGAMSSSKEKKQVIAKGLSNFFGKVSDKLGIKKEEATFDAGDVQDMVGNLRGKKGKTKDAFQKSAMKEVLKKAA